MNNGGGIASSIVLRNQVRMLNQAETDDEALMWIEPLVAQVLPIAPTALQAKLRRLDPIEQAEVMALGIEGVLAERGRKRGWFDDELACMCRRIRQLAQP